MKKLLLGTTALVAATVVSAPAMSAERIQLQLRGYHVGGISYTDMSGSDVYRDLVVPSHSSSPLFSGDYNEINFGSDSEVHFRGSTTLDNGIQVSFRAELELEDDSDVDSDADTIDEVYVQFDGGFGRVQFGQNDGVMDQMAVVAPLIFREHGHSDSDLDPFDPYSFTNPNSSSGASMSAYNPIDTVGDFSGDDIKIIYFTPEMNGFQLGLSFAPNPCKNDTGYAGCISTEYGRNYWEVSATWEVQANNVGFAFSGGYGQGEQGPGYEDPSEWTLGAQMSFGDFTLGGSYKDSTTLGSRAQNQEDTSFDIGASYETGPWAFNLAYGQREWSFIEHDSSSSPDFIVDPVARDNDAESWIAGLTYMYGPGMQIGFGVTTLDASYSWIDPGVESRTTEFDGTSFFLENSITF